MIHCYILSHGRKMTSLGKVLQAICDLERFLVPLLPFVNVHMVNYIVENHWGKLPPRVQEGLLCLPKEKVQHLSNASLSTGSGKDTPKTWDWNDTNLSDFMQVVKSLHLSSLRILTPLEEVLQEHGHTDVNAFPLENIMSSKKSHEVDVMSQVVSHLAKGRNVSWVIDVGSGLGYLSSVLVLRCDLNVLAVDSSSLNMHGAKVFSERLEKYLRKFLRKENEKREGRISVKRKKWMCNLSENVANNATDTHTTADSFWNTQSIKHCLDKGSVEEIYVGKGKLVFITKYLTDEEDLMSIAQDVATLCTAPTKGSIQDSFMAVSSKENKDEEHRQGGGTEFFSVGDKTEMGGQETNSVNTSMEVLLEEKCRHKFKSCMTCANETTPLALTGLHTCGGLAATSLRLFSSNRQASFLCNVGCCYHLLKEEFVLPAVRSFTGGVSKIPDTRSRSEKQNIKKDVRYDSPSCDPLHRSYTDGISDFPLSAYLCQKRFALGRNARMLALQATSRLAQQCSEKQHSKSLFWRALLQVVLTEQLGEPPQDAIVGHISKKCHSFEEYVKKAYDVLGLTLEISETKLQELEDAHRTDAERIHLFYFFRSSLAPVIEGLILLDRLAFLCQQDNTEAYLVQLFDPVISPRCYGIIAFRKNDQ